jgi:hypothetical protein
MSAGGSDYRVQKNPRTHKHYLRISSNTTVVSHLGTALRRQ